MCSLLDLHVVLAQLDSIQVPHQRTHARWVGHAKQGWASCPIRTWDWPKRTKRAPFRNLLLLSAFPVASACHLGSRSGLLRSVKQSIVTLDMEGVLTPEIWIAVAEKTGIPELRRTTRDEPDYDKLMRYRIEILDRHGIRLSKIQEVIGTLTPLPGAVEFIQALRLRGQVIVLSDTFEQFAQPLIRQLGWPTVFCHRLIVENDRITGYRLRMTDQKRQSVRALQLLHYQVLAAGDSYNDTTMLKQADHGFLFHAPENIRREFPQFSAFDDYGLLLNAMDTAMGN